MALECKLSPSEPVSRTETIAIPNAPADRGYAEVQGITIEGSWSDLAVDVTVPTTWISGEARTSARLLVFSKHESSDELVGDVKLTELPWKAAGDKSTARVRVSGHFSSYRVAFATNGGSLSGEATLTLIAWNGGGPASFGGESTTITAGAHTPRAALLYALGSDGRWHPAAFDSSGALTAVVRGSVTPTDGDPTPTDAVRVQSFPALYYEDGATWFFGRCEGDGAQLVLQEAWNSDGPTPETEYSRCNTFGHQYVVPGVPNPDAAAAPTQPNPLPKNVKCVAGNGSKSIKGEPGCLLAICFSNKSATPFYGVVMNTDDDGLGSPCIASILVPANGSAVLPIDGRWIACGVGISAGLSKEPDVQTDDAAINGACFALYV